MFSYHFADLDEKPMRMRPTHAFKIAHGIRVIEPSLRASQPGTSKKFSKSLKSLIRR
jgi:hypothetical protein